MCHCVSPQGIWISTYMSESDSLFSQTYIPITGNTAVSVLFLNIQERGIAMFTSKLGLMPYKDHQMKDFYFI